MPGKISRYLTPKLSKVKTIRITDPYEGEWKKWLQISFLKKTKYCHGTNLKYIYIQKRNSSSFEWYIANKLKKKSKAEIKIYSEDYIVVRSSEKKISVFCAVNSEINHKIVRKKTLLMHQKKAFPLKWMSNTQMNIVR